METAPGRNFLKITGILFIIAGSLEIFGSILGIIGLICIQYMSFAMPEIINMIPAAELISEALGIFILLTVISAVSGIFPLVMGIMGVKYCDVLNKAKRLMNIAVIYLIISFGSVIVIGIFGSLKFSNFTSFILPIFYLVGAYKNREAYKQTL